MFGKKRLKNLEDLLHGRVQERVYDCFGPSYLITGIPGVLPTLERLEAENKKLKAIVAELCDYVYDNVEAKAPPPAPTITCGSSTINATIYPYGGNFTDPQPNSASGGPRGTRRRKGRK